MSADARSSSDLYADKRRCVTIALKEFPKLSDRAIGEMCGIAHPTVAVYRMPRMAQVVNSSTSKPETRTGIDGKVYTIKPRRESAPEVEAAPP